MKFTAPPLPLPRFLQERFTDAEWLRRLKPESDGTPYDLGAHLGYDSQFSNNDRRLMAVWRGRCWSRRWQGFTGWIIGVEAPDGLSYVHCHAINRSAKDGMMVNAGEVIGTMGDHTHQLVVKNRTWSRATIVDPGPALRKLQEELRPLTDAQMQELKDYIKNTIDNTVRGRTEDDKAWNPTSETSLYKVQNTTRDSHDIILATAADVKAIKAKVGA